MWWISAANETRRELSLAVSCGGGCGTSRAHILVKFILPPLARNVRVFSAHSGASLADSRSKKRLAVRMTDPSYAQSTFSPGGRARPSGLS